MEKITNFLKNKSFPNYIFIILLSIILALLVSVIALAASSSSGSKEVNKEEKEDAQEYDQEDISTLIPFEKYKKAEKYLYIWEYFTSDYIINMCKEHHFTRVYLSIGCIENYWDTYYSQNKFPASGKIGSLDYEIFIRKLNRYKC